MSRHATITRARPAKHPGTCAVCGQPIQPGQLIINTGAGFMHLVHAPGGGR